MRILVALTAALVSSGCTRPCDTTFRPRDTDPVTPTAGPCEGESWGAITDPDLSVHVRGDGSDAAGDGTAEAPFGTLSHSIDIARGGAKRVAIGPGLYTTTVLLGGDAPLGRDDGFVIQGCSAEEVVITAAEGAVPGIHLWDAEDIYLAGFTLIGGKRAILVEDDSTLSNDASVRIRDVLLRAPLRHGISVQGFDAEAELFDVDVADVARDYDGIGYGAYVVGGHLVWEGGAVTKAKTAGVVIDGGRFDLVDLDISETLPAADSYYGRGLHAQYASGTIEGGTYFANQDAGVFFLAPADVTVSNISVDCTVLGIVDVDGPLGTRAATPLSGDGIVATSAGSDLPVSAHQVQLTGNELVNNARAGILLEDVIAELVGNEADDTNGYSTSGVSVYGLGATVVLGGDDFVDSGEIGQQDTRAGPLALTLDPLPADDPLR